MANSNTPNGFEAVKHGAGGCVGRLGEYPIKSDYTTAMYAGDIVLLASGYINVGSDGGGPFAGIFRGCQYTNSVGEPVFSAYWPGDGNVDSTQPIVALINDDPHVEMMVQVDTYAAANLGDPVDLVVTAGSVPYQRSRQSVLQAGTTDFRIVGLVGDEEIGAYADVIVAFMPDQHIKA